MVIRELDVGKTAMIECECDACGRTFRHHKNNVRRNRVRGGTALCTECASRVMRPCLRCKELAWMRPQARYCSQCQALRREASATPAQQVAPKGAYDPQRAMPLSDPYDAGGNWAGVELRSTLFCPLG